MCGQDENINMTPSLSAVLQSYSDVYVNCWMNLKLSVKWLKRAFATFDVRKDSSCEDNNTLRSLNFLRNVGESGEEEVIAKRSQTHLSSCPCCSVGLSGREDNLLSGWHHTVFCMWGLPPCTSTLIHTFIPDNIDWPEKESFLLS